MGPRGTAFHPFLPNGSSLRTRLAVFCRLDEHTHPFAFELGNSFVELDGLPPPGLPRGVHVNVHEGERVRAGEQRMDGPSNPHDIRGGVLRVLGEKELQKYPVNEIQEVYRLAPNAHSPRIGDLADRRGVNINDMHIEVISQHARGPQAGSRLGGARRCGGCGSRMWATPSS